MLCVFGFFFVCDRETVDSYTIAASPNVGAAVLRTPSLIYSSFVRSKSSLSFDGRTPLISEQDLSKKSWLERLSFQKQFTGEIPLGQGCSLTQTVFNGN